MFKELQEIQQKYNLSDIYIVKSTNGYNAFSLDKLTYDYLVKILTNTKYVDKDFIKYGLQRGFLTLRMGIDKKFKHILHNKSLAFTKSNAHKLFFKNIMNFPINDNIHYDNEEIITITVFPSNKHGFKKEVLTNGYN